MNSRFLRALCLPLFLAACAGPETPSIPPAPAHSFPQRISQFQDLHNARNLPALAGMFTSGAQVQSPVTPRHRGVDDYLKALEMEPYTLTFENTEVLRSTPTRAVTRSEVVAAAPGRFQLRDTVMIEWTPENGGWRISRVSFPQWSSLLGSWRRSGIAREGNLEWRLFPDGTYLIFQNDDFSLPAFRGRYRIEGNKVFLTDISAFDSQFLHKGEGSYLFTSSPSGLQLHRVVDESVWRSERFEGSWYPGR